PAPGREEKGAHHGISDRGSTAAGGDLPAGGRRDHAHRAGEHELDDPQHEDGDQHQRRSGEGVWADALRRL
ncbi:XRE family transcriptional regulator, partial [Dysosmobacter welbionis]